MFGSRLQTYEKRVNCEFTEKRPNIVLPDTDYWKIQLLDNRANVNLLFFENSVISALFSVNSDNHDFLESS